MSATPPPPRVRSAPPGRAVPATRRLARRDAAHAALPLVLPLLAACDPWSARRGATIIYRCDESPLERPGILVARDSATWRALWARLGHCAARRAPPRVDFARSAVVAVAHGYAGSSGHEVDVDSVVARGDTTAVYAVRRGPETCIVSWVITRPVVVVRTAAPLRPTVRLIARDVETPPGDCR